MKLRFIFSIVIVVFTNVNTIASNDSISNKCFCQIERKNASYEISVNNTKADSDSLSNLLSSTTALINSLNNNIATENEYLTVVNILVAMFGVAIAFVGVLSFFGIKGFRESKDEIEKYKENINNALKEKIAEIERLNKSVEEKAKKISDILDEHNYQIQFLQRNNQYLFSVTNSIVDSSSGNSETTLNIRNSLYNQYYIVKTFLPWSDGPTDSTQAAFMYLLYNGTLDNIDDLQFIANKDPDERKRKMAFETIGFIRARYDSGQAS